MSDVCLFIGGVADGRRHKVETDCDTLNVPFVENTPFGSPLTFGKEVYRKHRLIQADGDKMESREVFVADGLEDVIGRLIDAYPDPQAKEP